MRTSVIFLTFSPMILSLEYFSNDNVEKSDKCIADIVRTEFGPHRDAVIVAENFQNVYIPETPITVLEPKDFKHTWHENFLIYGENAEFFEKLKPKGKYIVVVQNASVIPQMFETAQKVGLHKFLIIQGEQTYYRMNSHFCGKNPVLFQTTRCHYPSTLFNPRKKFSNRCNLKVGYITTPPFVVDVARSQNSGIMVSMINLLGEVTKMKIEYQNSEVFDHEMLTNGSTHKIGRALENGEIDVAIGHLFLNDTQTTPFAFGPVLANDILKFTTPKPKKLKSYRKLFVVFNMEIWIRIFLGVLVMIFIFYVFALFENLTKASFLDVAFDVIRVGLGSGVSKLPKWVSFRILLVFHLLFSLSMDNIYLGNLSQIFALSSYDVRVDNLVKVSAASHIIFVVPWHIERLLLVRYVTRGSAEAMKRIKIESLTPTYLLNSTAVGKENCTITFQTLLDSHPSELALVDIFHVITDYLSLFVTYYFNKDTPFNEAITFWGQEIFEKGFPFKWLNDIKTSNVRISILPEEETRLIVLKLAHFEESFRVLFGGYILAVVALPLEFLFLKLEKMGVVRNVKSNFLFLVMLLKPPELHSKKKQVNDEDGLEP